MTIVGLVASFILGGLFGVCTMGLMFIARYNTEEVTK